MTMDAPPPANPFRKGRPAPENPFRKGRENRARMQNAGTNPSGPPQPQPPSARTTTKSSQAQHPSLRFPQADTRSGDVVMMDYGMDSATEDGDEDLKSLAKRQRSSPGTTPAKNKKVKTQDSPTVDLASSESVNAILMELSPPTSVSVPNDIVTKSLGRSPTKRVTVIHGAFVNSSSDEDAIFMEGSPTECRSASALEQVTLEPGDRTAESTGGEKEKEKKINPTRKPYGWGGGSGSNASLTPTSVRGKNASKSSSEDTSPHDETSNTTESASPTQNENNVTFEKFPKPKFSKTNWAATNDLDADAAIRGGEYRGEETSGVPAGDPRRNFQSYQPAEAIEEQAALEIELALRLVPDEADIVYDQLAERTLAAHLNDDFIENARETPYSLSCDMRGPVTESIIEYLKENGGAYQENLSQRIALAQATRIKSENKTLIRQMIEAADRRLSMPPPHLSLLSSTRRRSENTSSNIPSSATKRVTFAEPTQQSSLPQSMWNKPNEFIQSPDKNKDTKKAEASMHKSVESGHLSYRLAPLHHNDCRRVSVAEVAVKVIKQRATPVPEEMKAVTILYRQVDEVAYKKVCAGRSQQNEYFVTSNAPLKHLAELRAAVIAATMGSQVVGEDDIMHLPTVGASSRCRASKRAKMSHVHTIEDEDSKEQGLPQFDGPSEEGGSTIPVGCFEALVNMDRPFKPVGATIEEDKDNSHPMRTAMAMFPPLPQADADGNVIKAEDMADADDHDLLYLCGTKDEDANTNEAFEGLQQRPDDEEVKREINEIIDDYEAQDEHFPRKSTQAAQDKEKVRLSKLKERRDTIMKDLADLVLNKDRQDTRHLSYLQKVVTLSFPLPPKPRAQKESIECEQCGKKNHRTKSCKARLPQNPVDGFVPAVNITKALPTKAAMPENDYSSGSKPKERQSKVIKKTAMRQKERTPRAHFAFGFDGADDSPPEREDGHMKEVPDKDELRAVPEQPSQPPSSSLPPVRKFRILSKPDDLPRSASEAALSIRGDESPVSKRPVVMDTPRNANWGKEVAEDSDVEMQDATELPFPSLLDDHPNEEREAFVEYGDLIEQVDAQLRGEQKQSEEAQDQDQRESGTGDEVVLAAAAVRVMEQTSIQRGGEGVESAQQTRTQILSASQMIQHRPVKLSIENVESAQDSTMPPPVSEAKMSSATSTPNPLRRSSPGSIDAAGLEAVSSTRVTPQPQFSERGGFNPFRTPIIATTPKEHVNSDDGDDEPIKFTPLSAKTKVAGVTPINAGTEARGGGDKHNIEKIEVPEDDHFLPESGAHKAKEKQNRKSKAPPADSDYGEESRLPPSPIRPKRNTKRTSLSARATEAPETPTAKSPRDSPKSVRFSQELPSSTTADSRLVADQSIIPAEDSESDTKRDASGTRPGSPRICQGVEMAGSMNSRRKRASRCVSRTVKDNAEISEQDEEYSPSKYRKQHGRLKAVDSRDDVVESVEQGERSSKGKQSAKRTTRSRTTTPRAKSATADPESETVLCYNSKHVFLPVEIGDRVVRLFTKEDAKLYGKADEYDEFDGPWEVVDIRTRKKDKELVETILEEGISEEMRRQAWKMLLTAKIKLGIPKQAQEKDDVKPWVMLNQALPVLDTAGIKEGRLGAAGAWIESLDSYNALKSRMRKAADIAGSTNTIKKKPARRAGEDVESSLGVVNLRKNAFVAVVDKNPNWTQNDDYEVEKIRKKRLRLVWRGSSSGEERDQEDMDKWQEILKHKSGDSLRNYVILVLWWVQWAGWPVESSTWEPRASFLQNTAVVDHYNQHLDVFRDTPVEGAIYSLDHLFDHEDDQIEKVKRSIATHEQQKRQPARKIKPRKTREADDSDPEIRAKKAAESKKLADELFGEKADPAIAKAPKSRPQLDDETTRSPGLSRRDKALAKKEAKGKEKVDIDWKELFGDEYIPSPEKSQSQPAPVAQMRMMQPGEEPDTFGEPNAGSTPKATQESAREGFIRCRR